MRKWVLLFLLLANVLVFFGYSMLQAPEKRYATLEISRALELRLVSEVPTEALRHWSENAPQDESAQTGAIQCLEYSGIRQQTDADEIVRFLTEQGMEPLILLDYARARRFHLLLPVPSGVESQQRLLARFQALQAKLQPWPQNPDYYLIGEYASRSLAERQKAALGKLAMTAQVGQAPAMVQGYRIRLKAPESSDLLNRINGLLQETYSQLKIEKKRCQGVAS